MPILDERHDFAHPVEPDTAWSESYYFNAYDPVTDTGLFTRIGIRPNEGTMDVGLSVWLPASELATVHGVRPQREMTDSDLAVAGVRYERLRPMAEWRITCDAEASVRDLAGRRPPRTTRVALDLVFHALAPAVGSDGQGRAGAGASAATRASVGKGHLEQAGRWSGWIEADGVRHALGEARGHPRARHRQARARARAARRCSARGAGGARGGRPPHAHQRGARALDLRGPHRLRDRRVPPPARRGRPSGRAHRVREPHHARDARDHERPPVPRRARRPRR